MICPWGSYPRLPSFLTCSRAAPDLLRQVKQCFQQLMCGAELLSCWAGHYVAASVKLFAGNARVGTISLVKMRSWTAAQIEQAQCSEQPMPALGCEKPCSGRRAVKAAGLKTSCCRRCGACRRWRARPRPRCRPSSACSGAAASSHSLATTRPAQAHADITSECKKCEKTLSAKQVATKLSEPLCSICCT